MMSDHKGIYEMELHDEISIGSSFCVLRVPGGWIYKEYDEQVGGHMQTTMTFVPYHNEFQTPLT